MMTFVVKQIRPPNRLVACAGAITLILLPNFAFSQMSLLDPSVRDLSLCVWDVTQDDMSCPGDPGYEQAVAERLESMRAIQSPQPALPACELSSVTLHSPSSEVPRLNKVAYDFNQTTDSQDRAIVRITESAFMDAQELLGEFDRVVRDRIPKSDCGDRYALKGISLAVPGPDAVGRFHIQYENWFCGWTRGFAAED